MELALNLGWTGMAIAMCWLWARNAPYEGPGRRTQLVALALVLVTMFVVITMYDDLAMAQNPAETRCFQKDDKLGAHMHATFHPAATWAPTCTAAITSNTFRFAGPRSLPDPTMRASIPSSIQNRPPPAA
jgi:hypothetical protein